MKKFFYGIAALAMVFAAASCQPEGLESASSETVIYEIQLPAAVQTKGEIGYATYDLYYEVYKTSDVEALDATQFLFDEKVEMSGNTTTVKLELLNNHAYTVLFWANQAGTNYYKIADDNKSDLLALEMNLDGIKSNNDDRDAFCAVATLAKTTQSQNETVKLRRPFSQVNIGTIIATDKFDITPITSIVTIKGVPTTFNVATGLSGNTFTDIAFAEANVPTGTTTIKNVGYTNVAMNYIYVPEGTVDVEYTITTLHGNVSNEVPNVPVEKNHRTYIIGNLLTSNATYNIEILPDFEDDIVYEYVAEGVMKDENGVYIVTSVAGCQTSIDLVEDGETIILANDICVDQTETSEINALYYTGDKSFNIDLNGYTLTGNTSNAVIRIQKAETEGEENTITIKNGTIEALENSWSAISIGSSSTAKTTVNLVDLTVKSQKANDMAVRARKGADFYMTDCEVIATNAAGAICAGGGNVTLDNVNVTQTGYYNWNSVALGVNSGSKMTVKSGNYTSDPDGDARGTWVAYVMSSGGILEINGGTFNGTVGQTASAANACGIICADAKAEVYINGGKFISTGAILDMRNNTGVTPNPKAVLAGGEFSSDPRVSGLYASNLITVADGYVVTNADGTFAVVTEPISKVGTVGYGMIDNAEVAAEDALAVLNGGTDNAFFSTENDIITVK